MKNRLKTGLFQWEKKIENQIYTTACVIWIYSHVSHIAKETLLQKGKKNTTKQRSYFKAQAIRSTRRTLGE